MDDRLKNLKKAMDRTAFSSMKFTEQHKENVQRQLSAEELKKVILSLLFEAKSGIEITQLLHVRGIHDVVNNEGMIYSILHEQESDGYVLANWKEGVKRYELTKTGKKQLQQGGHVKLTMKERLLGVRMHAE
ncbi:helix-turn-helix transcriptional regulator [Solibacillus isronensis]|uniref:helix-turn-helix transcriptional regulator n=1 Tax=Solibacillus isronensis TaxID=412383 RepID=UPI00203C653B|nr:helix-turn-helix transcriptional regulator [Solibacillus isronensis]MCM3720696.1 helix-turn-helix transcriptional regulator [Solibacillus isronensis]